MRSARGFTLVELMVAAVVASILAAAAMSAVSTVQSATATQGQRASTYSAGRVAMDVVGRDIRNAGDSLVFLPPCLPIQHPQATFNCPAILEPHPWRVILARNAWVDTNGDGSTFSMGDTIPDALNKGLTFNQDPGNVVAYEFVNDAGGGAALPMVDYSGGAAAARNVWVGHIERIQNPFAFGGQPMVRSVLASNVILDDAMESDPTTGAPDPNYSFALFMYQLAFQTGEVIGDPTIVSRPSANGMSVSPPMRFFPIGPATPFAGIPAGQPFAGNYPAEILGLQAPGAAQATLLVDPTGSTPGVSLWVANSELRRMLDRDRVRAVRVSFKLFDARSPPGSANAGLPEEDPTYRQGLDVDGNLANGSAHVATFKTLFEIKAMTSMSDNVLL